MHFYQKTKTKKFSLGQFNFRIFILVGTAAIILTYLISINNTATKGIEISQMQREMDKLNEANRSLNIKIDELKSLNRIEALSNSSLSMVAAENYKYLPDLTKGSVAIKK